MAAAAGPGRRCTLTVADRDAHDADREATYSFVGERAAPAASYALVFDAARHACTLEPLTAAYAFNLSAAPWEPSAAQLAQQYPQIELGARAAAAAAADDDADAPPDADVPDDLFDDAGASAGDDGPDPDNPFDYRHLLAKRAAGGASRSVSPAPTRPASVSAVNTPSARPQRAAGAPKGRLAQRTPGPAPVPVPSEAQSESEPEPGSRKHVSPAPAPAAKKDPQPTAPAARARKAVNPLRPNTSNTSKAKSSAPTTTTPAPKASKPAPKSAEIIWDSSDEDELSISRPALKRSSPTSQPSAATRPPNPRPARARTPSISLPVPAPSAAHDGDGDDDDDEDESDDANAALTIEVPDAPRGLAPKQRGRAPLGLSGFAHLRSPSRPISLHSAATSNEGSPASRAVSPRPRALPHARTARTQDLDVLDLDAPAASYADSDADESFADELDMGPEAEPGDEDGSADVDGDVEPMDIGSPVAAPAPPPQPASRSVVLTQQQQQQQQEADDETDELEREMMAGLQHEQESSEESEEE